jgi:uncharacterized membrane protein YkoI
MRHVLRLSIPALGLIVAVGSTLAFTARQESDDDEVVQLSRLPEAVRRTIREHAQGGDIEKIERGTEHGRVVYEVEVEGAVGDFEFIVAQDGTFLGEDQEEADEADAEHAEAIAFDDAPMAVRDAYGRLAGDATASRVERITDEEVTKYEIEFAVNGGNASLTLAETGDLLERESPVPVNTLPDAIRREIRNDFPGAQVKAAEAVEVHYFEMEIEVNGRTIEVAAFATGDIEDHIGGIRDRDRDEADEDHEEHHGRAHHDEHEDEDDE